MMKKKGVDQRPHSSTRPPVPPPVLPGICQLSLAVAKTIPLFLDDIIYIYYLILCSFLLQYLSQIGNSAAVRHFSVHVDSLWETWRRQREGLLWGMWMPPPKSNKIKPKHTELFPSKSLELGDSKTTLNLLIYYR